MKTEEIENIIKKYNIAFDLKIDAMRVNNVNELKKVNNYNEYFKNLKPVIREFFKAKKAQEDAARERKEAFKKTQLAKIEGLAELENACDEWGKYRAALNASFDDECGCCHRPAKPASDIEALKAKYPKASFVLEVSKYYLKSNDRIYSYYKKAYEAIIANPENFEQIKKEFEKDEKEFVNASRWN